MSRPIVLALLVSFAALSGGTATAGDGWPHGRPIVDKPGPGFGPGHGFRRPHRVPFFPIYRLGRGGDVNLVVQQTVVSVQALPAVPSIRDLPVSAGIRDTLPAQPAVIVVNARTGVGEPVVRSLSAGPKIIDVAPEAQVAAARAPFAARVVHLSVPAGR